MCNSHVFTAERRRSISSGRYYLLDTRRASRFVCLQQTKAALSWWIASPGAAFAKAIPNAFASRRRGKENKTPGGENYLDPPGAELLAWPKIDQATRAGT
jgi:hypothetical protein